MTLTSVQLLIFNLNSVFIVFRNGFNHEQLNPIFRRYISCFFCFASESSVFEPDQCRTFVSFSLNIKVTVLCNRIYKKITLIRILSIVSRTIIKSCENNFADVLIRNSVCASGTFQNSTEFLSFKNLVEVH